MSFSIGAPTFLFRFSLHFKITTFIEIIYWWTKLQFECAEGMDRCRRGERQNCQKPMTWLLLKLFLFLNTSVSEEWDESWRIILGVSSSCRTIWTLLFIICFVGFVYQVYDRVMYFITWPVSVNIEVTINETVVFPAIMFCNTNSFRWVVSECSTLTSSG
jgi:hypothetical protein